MHPSVAVVGAGRLGTALGSLLARRNYPITGVVCRSRERARRACALIGAGTPETDPARGARDARIVLFAVPDDALREVSERVREGRSFRPGDLLVHTSGTLPAEVLGGKGTEGALLLSLHPLQTVADPSSGTERLVGAHYGLEGEEEALAAGRRLVEDLGGRPVVVPREGKALYHAAACVASNYLVTLVDASLRLQERVGVSRSEALKALMPLLEGTLENVARLGVPGALTGPIDRGDVETLESHLEALASEHGEAGADGPQPGNGRSEELRRLDRVYRTLGLDTLELVRRKRGGLAPTHDEIEKLLRAADEGPRAGEARHHE